MFSVTRFEVLPHEKIFALSSKLMASVGEVTGTAAKLLWF